MTEKTLSSLRDEDDVSVLFDLIMRKIICNPLLYFSLPGVITVCVSGGFWLWVLKTYITNRYFSTNLILLSLFNSVVGLIFILTGIIIKALNFKR